MTFIRRISAAIFLAFVLTTLSVNAAGSAVGRCEHVFATVSERTDFSKLSYYVSKLREAKDLDSSAFFAVALRALIMTTTKTIDTQAIPLKDLHLIHPIDNEAAVEKLQKRVDTLKTLDLHDTTITTDALNRYLPSKNLLRVIKADNGHYVVFDGNGRLVAIQQAFGNRNVSVEVEVYTSNSRLLQIILTKLRTLRGVMPGQIPAH